jgi:hypothetical protein
MASQQAACEFDQIRLELRQGSVARTALMGLVPLDRVRHSLRAQAEFSRAENMR